MMPLSPEQQWTLVACGLVAHADEALEVGEWDQVLWMLDERLEGAEADKWRDLLADRQALEERFSSLTPPLPMFGEGLLEKAWRMALADGAGSEIEAAVHDRIAKRLGIDPAQAAELRAVWSERAATRAELVVGYAAVMANLDGRMDSSEAVWFDGLLDRLPVPVARRVDLAGQLHNPPDPEAVIGALAQLSPEERGLALLELAPLVHASARGDRERQAFLDLATRLAVPTADAEKILES